MTSVKEESPSLDPPVVGEGEQKGGTKEIDPKVGRSNNLVLIPNLDLVDADLSARQRDNRPFKVIQNLPFSEGKPNYSRFDHPLSMKDSATLYNSLVVSRYNWLHNIFRSYWTRREQYANLTDRKRDKMSKFTECQITCGPHTFDISMYILKDDEKERLYQEEIDKKKEMKNKRKEERIKKVEVKIENVDTKAISQSTEGSTKEFDTSDTHVATTGDLKKDESNTLSTQTTEAAQKKEEVPASKQDEPQAAEKTNESIESKVTDSTTKSQVEEKSEDVDMKDSEEKLESSVDDSKKGTPLPVEAHVSEAKSNTADKEAETAQVSKDIPLVERKTLRKDTKKSDAKADKAKVEINDTVEHKSDSTEEATAEVTKKSTQEVTTAVTKDVTKEASIENTKEDIKEDSEQDPKGTTKENAKGTTEENAKENTKENTKANTKENTEDNTKDDVKEDTEESTKEDTKHPKESDKKVQETKEEANEGDKADKTIEQKGKEASSESSSIKEIQPSPPKPKPQSDNMSSPENTIMISNLNAIARVDANLNSLMKIVASGTATHDQIMEFQEYIQKARSMGDVNGYYKKLQQDQREQQEKIQKHHQLLRQQQEQMRLEKQKQKEEQQRLKILAKQEKAERKAREKEEREKEKEMKRLQRELEKEQKKLNKQKGETPAKLAPASAADKDEKLTAFQERYSKDATLLFEFQENSGARFYLPKDSIIEIVGDDEEGKEESRNTADKPQDGTTQDVSSPVKSSSKPKKQFAELIVSFVLIHNQEDIDAFEHEEELKRQAEEEQKRLIEEEKKREEERRLIEKQEAGDKEDLENQEDEKAKSGRPKRRKKANKWGGAKRSTRSSVKVEPVEVPEEILEEPEPETPKRPIPVFSTTTITLSNVPMRFADLIKDSTEPLEVVQAKMKETMSTGIRLSTYHTWLKLDGKKDEYLSELLRFNLNRLDYMTSGGKLKGKAMLKRIAEVVGSESDLNLKRQRKD